MNHIFQHINYLLLRRDCVIVPGFGAFIAMDIAARIDRENGLIIAPVRRVMFNQAVVSDDGLLATSVARKLSISFEEAREVVAREVDIMRRMLAENGSLECGNLGELRINEEGKISYSPITLSLGFENISLKNVSPIVKPVETEQVEEVVSEETEIEKKRFFRNFFKGSSNIAAAVALVFAMALAVVLNPIPRDTREERASVVPVEVLIPSNDKEKAFADKEEAVSVEIASPVTETEVSVEEIARDSAIHYLVVGTFSSRMEADRFIGLRSTEEFPLMAIESKKLTRVALASSDDRDALRQQLNSSKVRSEFPGSWIWTAE